MPKWSIPIIGLVVLVVLLVAIHATYAQDNGTTCLSYLVGERAYHVNNVRDANTVLSTKHIRIDRVYFAHSPAPVFIVVGDTFRMYEVTPAGIILLDL